MLKNITFKKIALATLLLLVSAILYHYPQEINQPISSLQQQKRIIYLIDENNYVSMTEIDYDTVEGYIRSLIVGDKELPNGFKAIIPEKTKLLDFSVEEGLLKVNFSKEFLTISKEQEEKMIESIVFSLTSLDGINKVMLFVEGEHLNELPHSHKKLDLYLDRNYGINKVYDIQQIKDTSMVTIYYTHKDYYIPVSFITNDTSNKVDIIIRNMKSNIYTSSHLSSQINYNVALTSYSVSEDVLTLNFDDFFLDYVLDGKLKEEVKYTLFYSFHDTLGVNEVLFSVNDALIEQFRLEK